MPRLAEHSMPCSHLCGNLPCGVFVIVARWFIYLKHGFEGLRLVGISDLRCVGVANHLRPPAFCIGSIFSSSGGVTHPYPRKTLYCSTSASNNCTARVVSEWPCLLCSRKYGNDLHLSLNNLNKYQSKFEIQHHKRCFFSAIHELKISKVQRNVLE